MSGQLPWERADATRSRRHPRHPARRPAHLPAAHRDAGPDAVRAAADLVPEAVRRSIEAKEEFRERFFRPARDRRAALLRAVEAGARPAEELPNDLLTLLLKAYDDWDEDEMLRECIFYLGASASTTSQAAPHVLFEILSWVERHPQDAARLQDVTFLRAAVHETLRLHPPAPALMRAALEDVTLSTGRVMRAGVNFALDLNAVNRRPEVFGADAAEFNPHRTPIKGVHGYGESFGAGPHVCPGRLIAVGAAVTVRGDTDDATVGVLVRLMEELFRYDVSLDPADPPRGRSDTLVDRYDTFTVVIAPRREALV
jgi:cytochrome P450